MNNNIIYGKGWGRYYKGTPYYFPTNPIAIANEASTVIVQKREALYSHLISYLLNITLQTEYVFQ